VDFARPTYPQQENRDGDIDATISNAPPPGIQSEKQFRSKSPLIPQRRHPHARAGGFVLTREEAAGKWGAATYSGPQMIEA
jgi:hypothetical protein